MPRHAQQFSFDFAPPASQDEEAHRLQKDFVASPQDWIVRASTLLKAYDAAIMRGNHENGEKIAHEIRMIAVVLNGGTRFGMAVDQGGLVQLHNALLTHPGHVPMWGKPGTFTVRLDAGCQVRVEFGGLMGTCPNGFAAHVVDTDALFLSKTGYRSFGAEFQAYPPPPGMDVAAWCRWRMDAYVVSKDQYKKPGLVALIPRCVCGHMQDYHRPQCPCCDCLAFQGKG